VSTDRPCALVSGGARRVGLAIARAFEARGFDLVLTYNRSEEEARAAAAELGRDGASVRLERLDLDDLSAVESAGARLAASLPRLDVLVHNASVYGPSPLAMLSAEEVMKYYRVHAAGPLLLTRALALLLEASPQTGGGAVVAMLDLHATGRPRKGFSAYSMSKAALAEMVRSLARDLAPRVRVNGVAPGVVAWPEKGVEADEGAQRAYLARVPLARAGAPEEAAEVVRWLAMDATYVTGQVLRVDGGRSLT
jgi:pteridine reductase